MYRELHHQIETSRTNAVWFKDQKEMAQFLNLQDMSKGKIRATCIAKGYGVTFDSDNLRFNVKLKIKKK